MLNPFRMFFSPKRSHVSCFHFGQLAWPNHKLGMPKLPIDNSVLKIMSWENEILIGNPVRLAPASFFIRFYISIEDDK